MQGGSEPLAKQLDGLGILAVNLRRSIKNILAAPERNCLVNVEVNGKLSERSSCASSVGFAVVSSSILLNGVKHDSLSRVSFFLREYNREYFVH